MRIKRTTNIERKERYKVGPMVSERRKQRSDLTTFYFSKFPEYFGDYEMWKIFQRYGRPSQKKQVQLCEILGRGIINKRFWLNDEAVEAE